MSNVSEAVWHQIAGHIADVTEKPFAIKVKRSMAGGCINQSFMLEGESSTYFIKLNQADKAFMFEAEAAGLSEIAGTNTLRVPCPVCYGSTATDAYLVLEYIPLQSGTHHGQRELGYRLADMHRVEHNQYGWIRDNTIGTTRQKNAFKDDWVAFWRDNRLAVQLGLAANRVANSPLVKKGELLLAVLPGFFHGTIPRPALLHGDLWGGNWGADSQGHPVVFDPAVYYGDRESDLAMTELFGGYSEDFYAAYHAAYPLDAGYATRKTLYNLYHILNHFNLFGGGYARQAEQMIDRLLSEIR